MTTITNRSNDVGRSHCRVRVHAIETGFVRVRSNQVQGRGEGLLRLGRTFIDRSWSEWLPIYAWLIDHPEGMILVDTGQTARSMEQGYFPAWHPYYARCVEFRVEPDDEIGPQLENRWVNPREIAKVVITHLHTDHAGGLHHFPNSEILVERAALDTATSWSGRMRGFLPQRWPQWFDPTTYTLEPEPIGPFERSRALTRAGDVYIVPTPGHTTTHVSVVVRTPNRTFFLAGDASYTQRLMVDGAVDGISSDDRTARFTLQQIRTMARHEPLVYLPSHDPDSALRLDREETVFFNSRTSGISTT